jgi:predicted enzyme related to lactoylglutathione lyase
MRGAGTAQFEKTAQELRTSLRSMISLAMTQIWVHDQEVAKKFYTSKLGWEVRQDAVIPELGGFRFLTVGPPAQPNIAVALLLVPPPPIFDEETATQLKALVAKGKTGGLFLSSDDIHADYEALKARGVEFYEEPTEYPYGTDSGFHDPSGNSIRLAQVKPEFSSAGQAGSA